MMVIISYDVATSDPGGKKRLRKVAKECQNHAQRVQNSVFEAAVLLSRKQLGTPGGTLRSEADIQSGRGADHLRRTQGTAESPGRFAG